VAQKKLVEHNALLQAVEMGMSKDAIMEKFNIKNLPELKVAYFDALVALDKIKDVKKGQKPKKVDNKVSINSRGSLVIPKKLIDDLDLGEWIPLKLLRVMMAWCSNCEKTNKDDLAKAEWSYFGEKRFRSIYAA
jgi:hypothetical protein